MLDGCQEAQVGLTVKESYNQELQPVQFRTVEGTVYGNVTAEYDNRTGEITVQNLPDGAFVMAAAYSYGQMMWVSDVIKGDTIEVPDDVVVDTIKVFWMNDGWKPIGQNRTIAMELINKDYI